MPTAKKKPKEAPALPPATREAVYPGPLEQINVEGVGVILAGQDILDNTPLFALVQDHSEFVVRPL